MRLLIAAVIFTSLGFPSPGIAEPLRILPYECRDDSRVQLLMRQKSIMRRTINQLETLTEARAERAKGQDVFSKHAVKELDRQISSVEPRALALKKQVIAMEQHIRKRPKQLDQRNCWRPRLAPYKRQEGLT